METVGKFRRDHLTGCIRAFLEGKKTINWVMSFVIGHRLPRAVLQEILIGAKASADPARYEALLSACRKQGFL